MPLRWPSTGLVAAVALLVAAWTGSGAQAQQGWLDVYSCGGSKGHSYFLRDGWSEDAISQGVIILRRLGDEFDVQIGDATARTFSARDDGAAVFGREQGGVIQVVAVYPTLTVETYLFSAPVKGRVTLAWTSSKRSGFADRASVFVSSCLAR